MSHSLPSKDNNQTSFKSLFEMRKSHLKLIDQSLVEYSSTQHFQDILKFIERARKTGFLLGAPEDRSTAQMLLNYWSNELIRLDFPQDHWPDSILSKYDQKQAPELNEKDCPYPGLKAFEKNDYDLFFGRAQLIEELLERLESQRLLVVVGATKSGKSSLVKAGLLPELKNGRLNESENWFYPEPTTPKSYLPDKLNDLSLEEIELKRLEEIELKRLKANKKNTSATVLIIDQLEDLFTLDIDKKNRRKFAEQLRKLYKQPNIKIILTIREDFQSDFEKLFSSFKELSEKCYVEVTPFTSSQLKEVIQRPAQRKGLQFEDNIINELVRDLEAERMPLPLLQFVLIRLWKKREKNLITENVYRQVTGNSQLAGQSRVHRALSNTAELYTQQLSPEERETLEQIVLQLLQPSLDSEVQSRFLQIKELYTEGEDHNQTKKVIAGLHKSNLLYLTKRETSKDNQISDDDQIEIVHQSLVKNWSFIQDLLKKVKLFLKKYLTLSLKAKEWESKKKNPDLLLRGKELDQVQQLIRETNESKSVVKYLGTSQFPNALEKEFINRSLKKRLSDQFKTAFFGLIIIATSVCAYYFYLQKQNEFLEMQNASLKQELEKTKEELKVANNLLNQYKNAEDSLERYKESIQQFNNINIRAEKLLEAAKKSQEQADKQLIMAEDMQQNAEKKSGNFWLGTFIGLLTGGGVATFAIAYYSNKTS